MGKLDDEVIAGQHLSLDGRPEVVCLVERTGRSTGFAAVVDLDGIGVEEGLQIHSPAAFGCGGGFVIAHRTVADSVDAAFGGKPTPIPSLKGREKKQRRQN